jgi:HEAT repeat protein
MIRACVAFSVLLFANAGAFADTREEKVARAIKDMESEVPKTRAAAAEEVGKIAAVKRAYGKPAIEPMLKLLKDKEEIVRAAAADALAKVDEPKQTVGPLIELVKDDKSEKVKIAAANGLGMMGESAKEGVKVLRETAEQARKDMKMQLAQACQRAIQNINGMKKK